MDVIIIMSVLFFLILGLIGSFIPVIPGPPLSYLAVLILHFFSSYKFDSLELIVLLFLVIIITFLDYWLQVIGVKKMGGGKKAINGTIIGLIVGLILLPPIGILLGSFIGAYIGARIEKSENAINIALGSIIGFIGGTILKFSLCLYLAYYAISNIINSPIKYLI